jgi:CRP-like cAMP-binding protein
MADVAHAARHQTSEPRIWATTLSDLLDGNKKALLQWLQGTQAFSDEISGFAQARMQLMTEAWSALLACRSPEQLVEHHRRFMAKATERCAEELTSLSQLALKATTEEPSK